MAKDSFKDQFPDYPIIPSKKTSKIPGAVATYGVYVALIGVPGVMLYQFSKMQVPTAAVAGGMNQFTLDTARRLAMSQVVAGRYTEAAKNFKFYFASGGDDAAAMGAYAKALNELGLTKDAEMWIEKSRVKQMEDSSK